MKFASNVQAVFFAGTLGLLPNMGCGGPAAPPVDLPAQSATELETLSATGFSGDKLHKTDAEWKETLAPLAYEVLRHAETELPFDNAYWDEKRAGLYLCGGCELPLFESETKFRSGTGWPSFYEPAHPDNVQQEIDQSLGMTRSELLCSRCDGHLGHVFSDGPEPTGLRYCINSAALKFIPQEEEEPGKRQPRQE